MIWFISDTHYAHKNIVRGVSQWTDKSGCRDFDTLESHNDWVVDMINNSVHRHDVLYHLGDWSFGGKDKIKEFRDRINCERIHLVLGNHDHHQKDHSAQFGLMFDSIRQYVELSTEGQQLVLCHYPIESWNNMERGSKHLHGHVHGQGSQIQGRYDVGVDALGLRSLSDVAKLDVATGQRHRTIEGLRSQMKKIEILKNNAEWPLSPTRYRIHIDGKYPLGLYGTAKWPKQVSELPFACTMWTARRLVRKLKAYYASEAQPAFSTVYTEEI